METPPPTTPRTEPTDADVEAFKQQLGRPPRGLRAIAHRCPCGQPDVVETAPRLPDGTPFPTTYYLTCPRAASAIGTLEANGVMKEMTERLQTDPELAAAYRAAHEDYIARRDAIEVLEGFPSAGGMPDRVKCLHVLVGHSLAAGPGVNPLGDEALAMLPEWWRKGPCVQPLAAPDPADEHPGEEGAVSDPAEVRTGSFVQAPQVPAGFSRVAAVDCGTNSIRLLVADVDPATGELRELDRRMTIVRLGQDVDRTGRLAPEALERTFAACREYARVIRELGAGKVRFVATSASRDASNRDEFVRGVMDILGVEPEVISGEQEAEFSFTGATKELTGRDDLATPYLVVDIGGGSTEFVVGEEHVRAARSVDVGCVRMTERHLVRDGAVADPPAEEQIAAMRAGIETALDLVEETVPLREARTLVGLAGSVTTVSAIAQDLPEYDSAAIHHSRVSRDQVREITEWLLRSTHAERAAVPSMHPGRVDVIAAGALVLLSIMERTGAEEVVVSEHDILDGIAWSVA
ncbi:DUF501 domain-containing protein [Streptomyces luteolifulvus]|uniref:DUF501 domain-containing protein n=1 Tax=Streptomyces luteolifulvus TaxID=2615112 RepID=A0A6H9UWJ4_9ACTN|nr:DUF501 domain-containing protein [Streptomyces luteolifulvus]